ncbi:MAG: HAMP domain-containing sensor histidine kinase, partial [Clostridia bacterium]|nr:HAMP domain-containing sensor histidine kinase [Clostridia bacterium]
MVYLLILCAAFFVASTTIIRFMGEYLVSQKVREEQRITDNLAASAADPFSKHQTVDIFEFLKTSAEQFGGVIMVVDDLAVVQADSQSMLNGTRLTLGEVALALNSSQSAYGYYDIRGEDQSIEPYASAESELMGVYAAPMILAGQTLGALVYISDLRDVSQSISLISTQMTMWLSLVAIAAFIIAMLMSGFFTRPIKDLSMGINRMTEGDLSSRVVVRGHNEFSQLANAFNMMCQRLQTLDQQRNQFVSNASHELKTPLSAMKVLVQTLLFQPDCSPEMLRDFLGDIDSEIDRLSDIVADLLTLVKIDSGNIDLKPEKLSLDELINDTVRRLKPIAETRKVELSTSLADAVITMGDARRLEQVFYNLTDNALKYTPESGKVFIELNNTGRQAVISITDTGIGIPEKDIDHIFDRFYRVDKARA